jgi:hypothetical protein
MKYFVWILTITIVSMVASGCGKNPTEVDVHSDEFVFGFTTTTQDVHTLTPIGFEVTVTDDHGTMMSDFDQFQLEHRLEGTTAWTTVAMTHNGSAYAGSETFVTSGEYELRIMGMAHHGHELEELHHVEQHLHVERAHVEAGGYRVEYESSPGHIHEGESPMLRFWVMDVDADPSGVHPPVGGLTAQIRCAESTGTDHVFSAAESQAGVYESSHLVESSGDTRMGLLFTGMGGGASVAEFDVHVDHGH